MNKIILKPKSKFSYIIFINEKELGILPKKDILKVCKDLNIRFINDEQKENLLKKIKEISLNKFLNYLAYKERSELEAKRFLKRLFLNDQLIKEFLEYAYKNNFLNQERFAYEFTKSLFAKNKSKKHIFFKLKEKGISESLANKVLSQFDFSDDKRLDLLIEKLLKRYNDLEKKKKFEKTLSYLVRNGFEYDNVKDKIWNIIYKGKNGKS